MAEPMDIRNIYINVTIFSSLAHWMQYRSPDILLRTGIKKWLSVLSSFPHLAHFMGTSPSINILGNQAFPGWSFYIYYSVKCSRI